MPILHYPLEWGGPDRVDILWTAKMGLRDIQVRVDTAEVARFENAKALREPARIPLPDGGTLELQFVKNRFELRRNGELLPNRAVAKMQVTIAFIVALIKGGLGLLVSLLLYDKLADMVGEEWVWAVIAEAVAFLVIAVFLRRRSKIALGIATGLTGLDLAAAAIPLFNGQFGMLLGLWFNFLFLMAFIRTFKSFDDLNADEAAAAARRQPQSSSAGVGE